MTVPSKAKAGIISARSNVSAADSLAVDVQIACGDPGVPLQSDVQDWIQLAIRQSGRAPGGHVELAVRIVNAEEIRVLNMQYRQQDKVTNVLSFPAGAVAGLPETEGIELGDIVICASVVRAEAASQGIALEDHWAHVLIHGALHLLGYDHEQESAAAEMEGLEAQILARRGISNPYQSR